MFTLANWLFITSRDAVRLSPGTILGNSFGTYGPIEILVDELLYHNSDVYLILRNLNPIIFYMPSVPEGTGQGVDIGSITCVANKKVKATCNDEQTSFRFRSWRIGELRAARMWRSRQPEGAEPGRVAPTYNPPSDLPTHAPAAHAPCRGGGRGLTVGPLLEPHSLTAGAAAAGSAMTATPSADPLRKRPDRGCGLRGHRGKGESWQGEEGPPPPNPRGVIADIRPRAQGSSTIGLGAARDTTRGRQTAAVCSQPVNPNHKPQTKTPTASRSQHQRAPARDR
ncbi:hypothetical protein NDU88_007697 [Pleurodeles waltl]|uniref:Uncharacterized protein n=1 Tax=Pleurodeles waltl TaxID=8319 RepID=A0AAV7VT10_PLEWA|nr:hypothetical protein NDU88_007697 [Pleurodeles waltl]